ncbi:hypothetical protein SALBM311S_09159 [Streptomyces alboniger]
MLDTEVEQVVGGCSRERIDRLAGVADHAQVVPVAEPQVQQSLLEGADVLVLVHHEVLVLGTHLLGDVLPVWRMATVSSRTSSKSMTVRSRLRSSYAE